MRDRGRMTLMEGALSNRRSLLSRVREESVERVNDTPAGFLCCRRNSDKNDEATLLSRRKQKAVAHSPSPFFRTLLKRPLAVVYLSPVTKPDLPPPATSSSHLSLIISENRVHRPSSK